MGHRLQALLPLLGDPRVQILNAKKAGCCHPAFYTFRRGFYWAGSGKGASLCVFR